MVSKPEYVEWDGNKISRIYCKVCGKAIAGTVDRPSGSGPYTKVMAKRFKRFSTYAEVKFLCDDGSFHVTNGCVLCLVGIIDPDIMTEMLQADAIEQERDDKRTVVRCVAVDTSGAGLV